MHEFNKLLYLTTAFPHVILHLTPPSELLPSLSLRLHHHQHLDSGESCPKSPLGLHSAMMGHQSLTTKYNNFSINNVQFFQVSSSISLY